MRFRILGPLEVWNDDQRLAVGGPQQRALLAILLVHANRVVSTDRLIDYLWPGQPPPTARTLVQGCVAGLRRVLKIDDRQPLQSRPPGYLLDVRPGELDRDRFAELTEAAAQLASSRSNAGLGEAAGLLTEALSLWSGPALADVELEAVRVEAAQLDQGRLAALENRYEVELQLGRTAHLAGELQALVQTHPRRERLWALLMLALYEAGRQAEALEAYGRLRQALVDEIGVEPGATVRQLQQRILAGSDALGDYLTARYGPVVRPDPPTSQGEPAPAQLPAMPSAFTGRERQLEALDELLPAYAGSEPAAAAVPIALITGTAGVGKTALAVRWAHRVREHFVDGQLYVDLRAYAPAPSVSPTEALAGFLRAFGVPGMEIPAEVDAAASLYRTLLTGKRILVVLDNAGSVEQVRPLLPGNAGCVVLVTSRDRLAGLIARESARPIGLEVLDPAESTSLLSRVLGADRVAAEPEAATELAIACAGLPLALRIVAANLAFHPRLGLADHVGELSAGDRLGTLVVTGDEQSAVRAALDPSYASLDPVPRHLFRLLGLVPGPDLTARAAGALADLPEREAERLLERLAGAHLLTHHVPRRFAFHDLLRLYASERTAAEEPEAVRAAAIGRLYDWYLDTADAAARQLYPDKLRLRDRPPPRAATFGDQAEALAWLDQERSNLAAACRLAVENGVGRYAWLLADALRGYFQSHGAAVDWMVVARSAGAAAEAEGDLDARALAELNLADLRRLQGEYDTAIGHFGRAAELARRSGWAQGGSAALGNLGIVHQWAGRPHEAADHYQRALDLDRRTGWLAGQRVKLGNLANVYLQLGRLAEAHELLGEALKLEQQLGDHGAEAITHATLGETCRSLGRLDEALEHLERSVAMVREVGDRWTEAHALGLLADVHRDAGRTEQALRVVQQAVELSRETGNARAEANTLWALATIRRHQGRHDLAVATYEDAIRVARRAGARHEGLNAEVGLAAALVSLGRYDEARALAGPAATVAGKEGYVITEAEALVALAAVALGRGQLDEAVERAGRAGELLARSGDRMSLRHAQELFSTLGLRGVDEVRTRLARESAGSPDA